MASRVVLGIIIIVLLGASGFFAMNFKVETQYDGNGKFVAMKITPRGSGGGTASTPEPSPVNNPPPPQAAGRSTFRIATYNLGGLDEAKLSNQRVGEILTKLLRQFDLVALEGLRGKNQSVPARLVELLNGAGGRHYEFVTCPTQQRDGVEHYSGFLFDRGVLEVDRTTVHFVEDPQRLFRHKPLVGLFRTRASAAPFTFNLVAVDTDPDRPAAELDVLADVFRAVRDYVRPGGTEDDVIMLGNFEADDRHLGRLGKVPGIAAAIGEIFPTTTRGTRMADNLLFDRRATTEFTGRAEVVDMMREFQLTVQAACEISEHLPIWADFTANEGGTQGFVPRE